MRFNDEAEIPTYYNQETKFALEAVANTLQRHSAKSTEQELDDYTAASYIRSVYEKKIARLKQIKAMLELSIDEEKIHLLKLLKAAEELRLEQIQKRLSEFWKVLKSYDLSEQLLELKQLEEYLQKHPELYTISELDDLTLTVTPSPKLISFEQLSEPKVQDMLYAADDDIVILDFDAFTINRDHSALDIIHDSIPNVKPDSEQERIAALASDLERLIQHLAEEDARTKQLEHDLLNAVSLSKTQLSTGETSLTTPQQSTIDQPDEKLQKTKVDLRKTKPISHIVQKPIVPLRQRCSREPLTGAIAAIKAKPEKSHYLIRS